MGVDVIDVGWTDVRFTHGCLDRTEDAGPVLPMVEGRSKADDLGVDGGATLPGVFQVLDRQYARSLAQQAIFASNGNFYAATVVERLGHARDGLVRAGCACYTTEDEIERLIEAVRQLRAG